MLFSWKDDYSVNISSIDRQHKILVDMINEIHEAMSVGKGKDVVAQIIEKLLHYTKNHFTAEEQLMKKYGYPDYEDHKEKHNKMTKRVMSYHQDVISGKKLQSMSLSKFLFEWLEKHIMGTDKKYTSYLNEQGVE